MLFISFYIGMYWKGKLYDLHSTFWERIVYSISQIASSSKRWQE